MAKEGENTISPNLVIHVVSHSANATTSESAIPQLNIDPTLPPEEVVHLLDQHLKGLNLQSDATSTEHHLTLDSCIYLVAFSCSMYLYFFLGWTTAIANHSKNVFRFLTGKKQWQKKEKIR